MIKELIEKFPVLYRMFKYFIVAFFIVCLELGFFYILEKSGLHYLLAVVISFCFAIVLNWFLSRTLVFKPKENNHKKEIFLISIASIVGLGIQMAVTSFLVEVLSLLPIVGKAISVGVSFFWNFWFREKYVFNNNPSGPKKVEAN